MCSATQRKGIWAQLGATHGLGASLVSEKPWYGRVVPVNSTHPDYDATLPAWVRARDVLAGEDAVKAAGEKYLPRLDSQSEQEFANYVRRASFFGATARTLDEYLDLVFRRAPVLALGEGEHLKIVRSQLRPVGLGFPALRQAGCQRGPVGRSGRIIWFCGNEAVDLSFRFGEPRTSWIGQSSGLVIACA